MVNAVLVLHLILAVIQVIKASGMPCTSLGKSYRCHVYVLQGIQMLQYVSCLNSFQVAPPLALQVSSPNLMECGLQLRCSSSQSNALQYGF